MGDSYQSIVDLDAVAENAAELAACTVKFLLEREIILPEVTDECVLGGLGYRPARNAPAIQVDHGTDIFGLRTNGVEVVKQRTVFYSAGSHLICPTCGKDFGTHSLAALGDAIDQWYAHNAKAEALCPSCHSIGNLNQWFDPPWAFGNLGLTFWNWWPLKPEFIETIASLWKHRVAVVSGKI
jgi:hypothetical protein